MRFLLPTLLYEETNAIDKNKNVLKKLGRCALIVTGKSSAIKSGALDDLVASLNSLSIKHYIFDRIEENPSVSTIMSAREFAVDKDIDFVIGIGGGSPLDAAKAIALMLKHTEYDAQCLYDATKDSSTLPVVAIPTTCGTGSEVTGVSVLTRHELNKKGSIPHKIYPSIAFVDFKYIKNLPRTILCNTACDALCHSIESLLTINSSEFSSMFAQESLRFLGIALKDVEDNNLNDTVLSYLMHASTLAGMAIAHTGTSLPHALSYRLTCDDHIAHGLACSYFLKPFLLEAPSTIKLQILDCLGFNSEDEIYSLLYNLLDFSSINPETVKASVEEIKNNPAKLATASFNVNLNNYVMLSPLH